MFACVFWNFLLNTVVVCCITFCFLGHRHNCRCLVEFACVWQNTPGYSSVCLFSFVFARTCLVIPVFVRVRLCLSAFVRVYLNVVQTTSVFFAFAFIFHDCDKVLNSSHAHSHIFTAACYTSHRIGHSQCAALNYKPKSPVRSPSKLAQGVILLISIREVSGSCLGRDIDYPGRCSWFSKLPSGTFP